MIWSQQEDLNPRPAHYEPSRVECARKALWRLGFHVRQCGRGGCAFRRGAPSGAEGGREVPEEGVCVAVCVALLEEDRVEDVERDAEKRKHQQRAAATLARLLRLLCELAELVRDARRYGVRESAQRAGGVGHRLDVLLEAVFARGAFKLHRVGILAKIFGAELREMGQIEAKRRF